MRLLPFGINGVLVELDDLAAVLAGRDALERAGLPGVLELVPGARTILVRFDPTEFSRDDVEQTLSSTVPGERTRAPGELVEIPVVYDGEDLAEVATLAGMTVDELIRRHSDRTYDVAFTGFAPGFAYLSGGDPALAVPRRATPRTTIPAGAVGLAGEFSGVYPRQSPGGWQLIGRTPLLMWDADRVERPGLLRPGDRVRFVPTREITAAGGQGRSIPDPPTAAKALRIEKVPLIATVQDLGRPGNSAVGVARSGAMDVPALKRANRLVGNAPSAPGIEFTAGLTVRATGHLVVGLAGSIGSVSRVDMDDQRDDLSPDAPLDLRNGERLEITTGERGVYGYLAVLGGITAEQTLGSASTNVLTGIGPEPLATGGLFPVGDLHDGAVEDRPELAAPLPSANDVLELDVVLGPRDDWFTPAAIERFLSQQWAVSSQSNRVGIRLAGERGLDRVTGGELPSEGMQPGAVQVPPNGQPVVFGADHPVTGGYPVVATLTPHNLEVLSQAPAGTRVTFRAIS